jgi:hypothetical protein
MDKARRRTKHVVAEMELVKEECNNAVRLRLSAS